MDVVAPILGKQSNQKSADSTVFSCQIGNVTTEFAIISYTNRHLIAVTQTGSFGALISVEKDSTQIEKESPETFSIKLLLGQDDEDLHIAARFIAGQLNLDNPILFCFCLKDLGPTVLKSIVETLKKHFK